MALTEAQKRAVKKYNAKAYDEIKIRVKRGQKQVLKDIAEEHGESLNGYIKKAVQTKIKADTGEEIEL